MVNVFLDKAAVHSGDLILVNQSFEYKTELNKNIFFPIDATGKIHMERKSAILMNNLMSNIHGWREISAVSGLRSYCEQEEIYLRSLRENGRDFTEQFVALPGHSEHQTGLAVDLGLRNSEQNFICPNFPYNGICQSFRNNAANYGFIERYPIGKREITGISHEPWHFRYVGVPHAQIMTEQELTLEEYHNKIKKFAYGEHTFDWIKSDAEFKISYLPATTSNSTTFKIDDKIPYSVSGNNYDGFIITQYTKIH